MEVGIS